ncbi:MAG: alpha-ribazole phosphatase [Dehalococcoidales bacterium]|nr:alpha-ribazole phosphatase [Dehalococcoidales bacterium]
MSKLLLVRHGDTELASGERYWGHSDVELGATGLRQAERLRDRLATEKIDAIYSSDLQRALVTAKIIVSRHQLDIITCTELREINFGEIEGLTFDEASRLYPEVTKLWMERSLKLEYPGGESLDQFNSRVNKFVDRLNKYAAEETILIIAHSGVLRTLVCQLLGIGLEHRWQIRLDLASLSIIETYPQGAILNLLNDVSHLG